MCFISLKSKIIQKRTIQSGDSIGYGGTYVAKKEMIIATIPIGYADGFFRSFSNKINFFFLSKKVPMIGRVSMDLVTVDLSEFINLKQISNKEFEFIGDNNPINTV